MKKGGLFDCQSYKVYAGNQGLQIERNKCWYSWGDIFPDYFHDDKCELHEIDQFTLGYWNLINWEI